MKTTSRQKAVDKKGKRKVDEPHRIHFSSDLRSGTGGSWKKSPETMSWRPPARERRVSSRSVCLEREEDDAPKGSLLLRNILPRMFSLVKRSGGDIETSSMMRTCVSSHFFFASFREEILS